MVSETMVGRAGMGETLLNGIAQYIADKKVQK